MNDIFDVAIVGAGPSGIFTALELLKGKKDLKVAIFEKGKLIKNRSCPKQRVVNCAFCNPCNISSGWGGAGAFSDGKLSLCKDVGGWLEDYIGVDELNKLIKYVDDEYLSYGGNPDISYNKEVADKLEYDCSKLGMKFINCPVRHLGTEKSAIIMDKMYETISKYKNVTVFDNTDINSFIDEDGIKKVMYTKKGEEKELFCKNLVLSVGRTGASWLNKICIKNKITTGNNQIDIGVRVELPRAVTDFLTNELYEFKIYNASKTTENVVRTFCMNPGGFVSQENYDDNLEVVNGHSYSEKKSNATNFALLVSCKFTEPFKEPIKYGKYIAEMSNMLSDGHIMVQRLRDLKEGRRSTKDRMKKLSFEPTLKDAIPGDLSYVIPGRILTAITETLEALDKVCPGINGDNTILYGVEVKFYSSKVKVNNNLETEIKGIYAIGDGAGITRGLIQASISGVVVARDILNKTKES